MSSELPIEPHSRSATPLAEAIANQIEGRARDRTAKGESRLPSERQLAGRYGASRAIIRAAIAILARRGVIEKRAHCRPVFRTGRKFPAPGVASGRHTLALWLIHDPRDAERTAMLHGIQRAIDPEEFRLVVENPSNETIEEIAKMERRFLDRLAHEKDVAGAILWCVGGQESLPALERARSHGVALVFVDRLPPEGFSADHVGVDNLEAGRRATSHLVELGHERIAHITNSDSASTVRERLEGYRLALDSAGLPYREDFVAAFKRGFPDIAAEAREIVEGLLALKEPPTALFVVNDLYALSVLQALEAMGKRVPEDLAVVGFDGLEGLRHLPRTLTTVTQPFERIGARAVDLLLRRIHEGESAAYRLVLLEAPLSVSRSTRALRRAEPHIVQAQS